MNIVSEYEYRLKKYDLACIPYVYCLRESREMLHLYQRLIAVKFLRVSPSRQTTRRANSRASGNSFCAFRELSRDASSSRYVSRAFLLCDVVSLWIPVYRKCRAIRWSNFYSGSFSRTHTYTHIHPFFSLSARFASIFCFFTGSLWE